MNITMSDFSKLSHTIESVSPERALLLLFIAVCTLCTFFGWKIFARARTDEPAGGIPHHDETKEAATNGVCEKVEIAELYVKPVEEELLDGGKMSGESVLANEAHGRNGLEASVVTLRGTKGKRTTRRG